MISVLARASVWPLSVETVRIISTIIVFITGTLVVISHGYSWNCNQNKITLVETNFSFTAASQFESVASCAANRGSIANSLFILNHFLTNPFASPTLAESVNFNPLLRERALACEAEMDKLPNFLTVDFQRLGDLYEVARELNQSFPPISNSATDAGLNIARFFSDLALALATCCLYMKIIQANVDDNGVSLAPQFPLLPGSKGFCISLRKAIATFKETIQKTKCA